MSVVGKWALSIPIYLFKALFINIILRVNKIIITINCARFTL